MHNYSSFREVLSPTVATTKGDVTLTPTELHTLGIEQTQAGDYARAVESLGRALGLRPGVPAFHVDLAEAYRVLGLILQRRFSGPTFRAA
jgi:Flp pilus assembly protein TadD